MIDPLQAVENASTLISEVDSDPSYAYRRNFLRCRIAETLAFIQEKDKALALINNVQEDSSTPKSLHREIIAALAKIASASNDFELLQEVIFLAESLPMHREYLIRIASLEYIEICQKLVTTVPLNEMKRHLAFILSLGNQIKDRLNKQLLYSTLISFYSFLAKTYQHSQFIKDALKLYRELPSLDRDPHAFFLKESVEIATLYYNFGNFKMGLSILRDEVEKIQELESSLEKHLDHSFSEINDEIILDKQQEIIRGYSELSNFFLLFKDYSTWYFCITRVLSVQKTINRLFVDIIVETGCKIYIHTFEGIKMGEDIPSALLTKVKNRSYSEIDALQKMVQNLQRDPSTLWKSLLRISKALLVSKNDSQARKLSKRLPSTISELTIFDATKLYLELVEYSRDLSYLDPLLEMISSLNPQGVYFVRVNCELAEKFCHFSQIFQDHSLISRAVSFLHAIDPNHSYRLDCVNSWLRIAEAVFLCF
ncbi:MAG: hypothetical protein ACFFBD_22850 [Candidatus Hodarchaeota archaeon]